MFLGEDIKYWLTLKSKAEELGVADLIREIAGLRAKVSYYEARLDEMNRFRQICKESHI